MLSNWIEMETKREMADGEGEKGRRSSTITKGM
jgi:hypothetical protein